MMIFEDPTGRRWAWVSSVGVAAALVLLVVAVIVLQAVSTDARLAKLHTVSAPTQTAREVDTIAHVRTGSAPERITGRGPKYPEPLARERPMICAFVVDSDPASLKRLEEIGASLDVVFSDRFSFSTGDGLIRARDDAATRVALSKLVAADMPRITNTDQRGVWQPDAVSKLLRDDQAQLAFIENLVDHLTASKAAGVNVDIEDLESRDSSLYVDFLALLAGALHRHGLYLTVDVPMNDDVYDYEAIGKVADAVVVMAYDEHFPGGEAGPIAGLEWFEQGVREYAKRVPPEKLIVALGGYAYDWPSRVRSRNARVGRHAQPPDLPGHLPDARAHRRHRAARRVVHRSMERRRERILHVHRHGSGGLGDRAPA